MNAPYNPIGAPAFSWRYADCPECDTATGSRGCEECEGAGEVTCACASCFNVYPLNDDGECSDCSLLVQVEHLGPGRIAA